MTTADSQDIEQATATLAYFTAILSDHTRMLTRISQERIWAASGQAALESARILVVSSSATSTSILKNLVLPGIGHFSILDSAITTPADAGNNFFLNARESIGKPRAQEAVPLLRELNESVQGEAVLKDVKDLLGTEQGKDWLTGFSIVIAHNLDKPTLEELSALLWSNPEGPPLVTVRSAGFLAEFHIQYHEHCVSESHSENAPSLRITRPFPALLEWARSLDLNALDPTEHGHIPFVVILVRQVDEWRKSHGGELPKTLAEKKEFKKGILALKVKADEENFDEAEAQAWRVWSEPAIPSDIQALFSLSALQSASAQPRQGTFHALLHTLVEFTKDPAGSGTLPLSSNLPDMKSDTESYVRLQNLYRQWADVEKSKFKELFEAKHPEAAASVDPEEVDSFVKNSHHLRVLRGKRWGTFDADREALGNALASTPREAATHLALTALTNLLAQDTDASKVTDEALKGEVISLVGPGVELPEELDAAIGEIARAPTADIPNMAAFLGGLVAQEAIKMITEQYVPLNGYCVVDLVDSWTGVVG
ncbi:NEDD8-activating enzyme E1 regulatory subunit [Trametes pubescens]|uniref:NEDD8-activating enzyme E1 regulatory subunit n=1 Tax=Trametes pubescens TaxID=154538 RepID=A0A1M2W320_TRAPU|nr:NEDD8-activating enzyme E1 regulatory subunit [Trametes pubescens]